MKKSIQDKSYKKSLLKYEMNSDKMPSKKVKKYKRKERQHGKKEIKKAILGE